MYRLPIVGIIGTLLTLTAAQDVAPKSQNCGNGNSALGCGNSTNYQRCAADSYNADLLIFPYDAQYNGSSTTWSLTGNLCPDASGTLAMPFSFQIGNVGANAGLNVSRTPWDRNPFWFRFYDWNSSASTSAKKNQTEFVVGKFESSTAYWSDSQPWVVRSTKRPDGTGFDISGELVGTTYNDHNGWAYNVTCAGSKVYGSRGYSANFSIRNCNVASTTMNGTVTRDSVDVTFVIVGRSETTGTYTVNFKGAAVNDGPSLVTTGDVPTVTGSRKKSSDTATSKKSIASGTAVSLLLAISAAWLCFILI